MKIQAIKLTGKNRKSDIMIKSGQVVTITKEDGKIKEFDLDNLPLAENENRPVKLEIIQGLPDNPTQEEIDIRDEEISQFDLDHQIFKQGGDEILRIYVVDNFLYVNNNYLLFHDHDLNGTLEGAELDEFFGCYAKEDSGRYADHKAYFMAYVTAGISAKNKVLSTEYFNQCIAGYTREQALDISKPKGLSNFLKVRDITNEPLKEEILLAVDKWVYKRIQCGQLKNEDVDVIKARLEIV